MEAINGVNNIYQKDTPKTVGYNDKRGLVSTPEMLYGLFGGKDKGVNGKIDEGVFQGNTGDCWLLSGILSLSYTEEGSKLIKDAISKNPDGSYNVYFQGADKTYTISQDELDSANKSSFLSGAGITKSEYSTGDDDMLLIELAMEKLIEENEVPIETGDGLTGGSAYYLYQLFTNDVVGYANGDDSDEIKSLLNYYEMYQESSAATIGVLDGFSGLEDDHAYAIKSYENGIMTIVNPWDSTEDIKIKEKDLLNNIGDYDISIADSDLEEDMTWEEEYYA